MIDLNQKTAVVLGHRIYSDDYFISNLHRTQSMKYPFLLISLSVFHERGNIFSALHRLTRARELQWRELLLGLIYHLILEENQKLFDLEKGIMPSCARDFLSGLCLITVSEQSLYGQTGRERVLGDVRRLPFFSSVIIGELNASLIDDLSNRKCQNERHLNQGNW